jgi:hypothetical protein
MEKFKRTGIVKQQEHYANNQWCIGNKLHVGRYSGI